MNTQVREYYHERFDLLRCLGLDEEGEIWFVGSDVIYSLGYAYLEDPYRHCKNLKRKKVELAERKDGMSNGVNVVSEKDIHRLVDNTLSLSQNAKEDYINWIKDIKERELNSDHKGMLCEITKLRKENKELRKYIENEHQSRIQNKSKEEFWYLLWFALVIGTCLFVFGPSF